MPYCAVYGCKSRRIGKGSNIKFYTFPKDPTFQNEWIKACRRKDPPNVKNARICALHFTQDSFQRKLIETLLNYAPLNSRNLKPDAIPTENLPDETVINVKKVIPEKPKQKSKGRKTVKRKRNASKQANVVISNDDTPVINSSTAADLAACISIIDSVQNNEDDADAVVDSNCTEDLNTCTATTNTATTTGDIRDNGKEPQTTSLSSFEAKWKTEVGILCRLCMKSDFNCIPIFRGKGENMKLETKITNYLQLKISSEDKLPDQVCPLCCDAINVWDEYVMSCIEVENKLQELLSAKEEVLKPFGLNRNDNSFNLKESYSSSLRDSNISSLKENDLQTSEENSVDTLKDSSSEANVLENNTLLKFWTCENSDGQNNYLVFLMGNSAKNTNIKVTGNIGKQVLTRKTETPRHSETSNSVASTKILTPELSDSTHSIHTHGMDQNSDEMIMNCNPSPELDVTSGDILGNDQEVPKGVEAQNLHIINSSENDHTYENRRFGEYTLRLMPLVNSNAHTNETGIINNDNNTLHRENETSEIYNNVLYQNVNSSNLQEHLTNSTGCLIPNLRNSVKSVHSNIRYKCIDCPMEFANFQDWKNHKTKEHKKDRLKVCPFCNENVKILEFKTHLNSHSGLCKLCYKIIPDDEEYQHKVTHLKYVCKTCGQKFLHKTTLYHHSRTHSVPKLLYRCEECNTVYKWKDGFNRHMKRKHSETAVPVVCNLCDKQFYPWFIKRHMKTVHVDCRLFTCDICDKKCKTKNDIRHHIQRIHLHTYALVKRKVNKAIQCVKCGRYFASNVGLTLHSRIDCSSGRMCNKCGLFMETSTKFKSHMSTHHKSNYVRYAGKKFNCKYCSKSFNSNYSLIIHERSHSGERPFCCQICDKTFTSKHVLNAHSNVHLGFKRFHCEYCNKPFMQKKHLSAHVKIHFPRPPKKCPICSRSFLNLGGFRRHLKKHNY